MGFWPHPKGALSPFVKSGSLLSGLLNEQGLPFLQGGSRKAGWGFPEFSTHSISLLTLTQELLESRLKVLKSDLEDYEVFRSTEEKESKELLVRPCPGSRGPPTPGSFVWWWWSMCCGTALRKIGCML